VTQATRLTPAKSTLRLVLMREQATFPAMTIQAESLDQCLKEAAECDRLARLARTEASRMIMTLSAALWRRRAREATDRHPPYLH
jgi:hypothetical protein